MILISFEINMFEWNNDLDMQLPERYDYQRIPQSIHLWSVFSINDQMNYIERFDIYTILYKQ